VKSQGEAQLIGSHKRGWTILSPKINSIPDTEVQTAIELSFQSIVFIL